MILNSRKKLETTERTQEIRMGKNGTAYCQLEEQETVIRFSRLDNYADICTSDTTQKTRFDKLCTNNPKHWEKVKEDEVFSFYTCTPKSLISTRAKVTERVLTDEQRQELADRMSKIRSK